MFELEKQIERLLELRQLSKQIQAESEEIRKSLLKFVEIAGGKLVVGSYILTLSEVPVTPYSKVLNELKRNHPEIAVEIDTLIEKFQTISQRLDIAEKEN